MKEKLQEYLVLKTILNTIDEIGLFTNNTVEIYNRTNELIENLGSVYLDSKYFDLVYKTFNVDKEEKILACIFDFETNEISIETEDKDGELWSRYPSNKDFEDIIKTLVKELK